VLASGSEETSEARAGTISVVAFTTARALTASLSTISIKRVRTRRALLEVAGGSSVSLIADATNVFHRVPGSAVSAVGTGSKVLLGPASSTIVTVVRADGTLASNTLVASKALALTSGAVAHTLVGALRPGVEVVGIDNVTNPGKVLGASSQGAIRASPLGLTVDSGVAQAVVVELAGSVSGALVLAHTSTTVASLVPGILATSSPGLVTEGRLAGGGTGGLSSRLGGALSGLAGGLTSGIGDGKGASHGGKKNKRFNHFSKYMT